jgi:hypothetical protein
VIPGGGLTPGGEQWIRARRRFLLPVKVRSARFRRRFLEALEKAYAGGQLKLFGELETLRQRQAFTRWLGLLKNKDWVVYAKPPFAGPHYVLEYLGRYVHRLAISNRRRLKLEDGQVSFAWKDYRDPQNPKVMTVAAEDFLRLFLQHTVPPGLQRIRYYGYMANCHRARKLELCRPLLAGPCSGILPDCRDVPLLLPSSAFRVCPQCQVGILARWVILPAWQAPP